MLVIFPLGLVLLFFGLWYYRRGSTLTRACRWRLRRDIGPQHYRCEACGAGIDLPPGKEPRHCLRGAGTPQQ